MSSLFDKLNLRPQERRLVVIVGIAVFVVLNYMFVWSHFGDLGIYQQQKADARKQLLDMQQEIARKGDYDAQRSKLRESGGYVPSFQASTVLRRQVQNQALASKVRLQSITPRDTQSASNSFFDEKGLLLRFEAGEQELVDFLYNLGTNESLIRIEEISIGPDARKRTELSGRIGLVGSFQKTPPTSTTTTPPPPTPADPPTPPTPAAPGTTPKTKSTPPKTKSAQPANPPQPTPPSMTPAPKTKSSPTPQQIDPDKTKSQPITIPSRRVPPSS